MARGKRKQDDACDACFSDDDELEEQLPRAAAHGFEGVNADATESRFHDYSHLALKADHDARALWYVLLHRVLGLCSQC